VLVQKLSDEHLDIQVGEIEKGTSAWQSPLNIGDRIAMIGMIGILKKSALKNAPCC
jgi:hypothetical protein